jgi:tritrans,polycis-undecaprenyl-diphosphate synthase [geranylgeranyl-diphosphate specific]
MSENQIPGHIAVILDGNRRYAKKHNIPKIKGHEKGYDKIKDFLKWCIELGIREATLFCLSTENFRRSENELDYLFNLFRKRIGRLKNDKVIEKNKVCVKFVGRLSMFPKDIQKSMFDVMDSTKTYNKYRLNLAFAYGSKPEIIDAVNCMLKKGLKKVDENTLQDHLYIKKDVDILIRPGGEKRISNFLLWQCSYAEFYFLDVLWPEFEKQDLFKILEDFNQRERRFGK